MKRPRINLNFKKLTDADFLTKTEHIQQSMTGNAAFTNPMPTLTELETAVNAYGVALTDAKDLGKVKVTIKNQARTSLERLLFQLGMYVINFANGDESIFISSGYTLTKFPHPNYIASPGNVKLENGISSDQLVSVIKNQKGVKSFLHQITPEPPNDNTVWESNATSRSKYVFTNLQPGKQYWVRVAVVAGNEQIACSNLATQYVQ